MSLPTLFLILATSFGGPTQPDEYRVTVTRESSNLYRVIGKDIYIETRYCYEYVYSEDSLLRMNGRTGDIVFLDAGESCDVKGVYGRSDAGAGTYSVTVSHEDNDWYEIMETGGFVKTSLCLDLALADGATMRLNAYGSGRLYFSDGDDCMVEGVYDRLSL